MAKRAAVQERRRRTDDELLHLFVRPMQPVPDEPSQVVASVVYRLRTTNELFNLVFPFLLQEGAG